MVVVKQILMLFVLFREYIQQYGVCFMYVYVEMYVVYLIK